jgi:hypothetical protein
MTYTAANEDTGDDGISVSCYDHQIPPFVAVALDRLYGNIFSSLIHLQVHGALSGAVSTYVAYRGANIVALFLFRRDGHTVRVLNEGMPLDGESVARFCRYLFTHDRHVHVVVFHAIHATIDRLPFPRQQAYCPGHIVLTLPSSSSEYLISLGKNTRRNIKRYTDRLMRTFPTFHFEFYSRDDISEQQISSIIEFNKKRIADKNKTFAMDDEELAQTVALTKACGLVGVATIDGRICGGTIGYQVGENYFFKVIAHDPQYNPYWLGIICCYLTICECIARGFKEYNFLGGRYDYKFTLGAVVRDFVHLTIYRSHMHIFSNFGSTLRLSLTGFLQKTKFELIEKAGKTEELGLMSRLAVRSFNWLRHFKNFIRPYLRRR